MIAAILAGGFGKRLRPFTEDVPKPLVQVAGEAIIDWQIKWLKKHGVRELVILAGYKKEKLIEHLGSGGRHGVKITYVIEDEPLGTGGAIKNAEHVLSKNDVFIVVNGDILTNLDPKKLVVKLEEDRKLLGVIASIPLPSPYGVLKIEGDRVVGFVEKPIISDYWINAGIYALRPESLRYFPEKGDLEKTAFPKMAEEGVLGVVRYDNVFWRAIDTHKDLEEASNLISNVLKGEL
ncbi:nucleotidyltransferase family protein [Thermogladius sp.]|uniref:nucleotidyltransferase family protein n=1 Tax=Thermogladius sp. TaxID=2023064 RepID=UPI003D0A01B2